MSSDPRPETHGRVIAREFALGFGLVAIVAVAMCGLLLVQLGRVGGLVDHMRHDEDAIRLGGRLATAVRERYIHLAHALVEEDPRELAQYERWGETVEASLAALATRVPVEQRGRVEAIRATGAEIDAIVRSALLPALRAGDRAGLQGGYREVQVLAARVSADADVIAEAVEGRMVGAHISATELTRVGVIAGLACVALVLALSIGYTLKLRRSVLAPLGRLTAAARAFGEGALRARLGRIGRGELQEVAAAFDHMADELVAREERLLRAERMAAIGQLAAGVAHEMNNPIGVIRGYLKTMRPDEDPEVLREELKILDEEAAACQRIADDLLAYARVPSIEPTRLRMHEFIAEAVRRLAEGGELDGGRVSVDAAPGVVRADPWRLRQVIANLIQNAAQVSPPGAPVEVAGRPVEGGYAITVSDRGPGVAPADRARIFEPFFSKRGGGSGLGLAVCQGLVRAHGGTIEVSDRPGGGAVFRVEVPAEPAVAARQEAI